MNDLWMLLFLLACLLGAAGLVWLIRHLEREEAGA